MEVSMAPVQSQAFRVRASCSRIACMFAPRVPCFTTEISVDGTHEEGNGNGNANAPPGSGKHLSKGTLPTTTKTQKPGDISPRWLCLHPLALLAPRLLQSGCGESR